MYNNTARKVAEVFTCRGFDPVLNTKFIRPSHTFKKGVEQANNDRRSDQLRPKFSPLRNTAGNNGWNSGGKGQ